MLRLTLLCYSHQFIIFPQGPVYWPVAGFSTDRDFIDSFFSIKDNLKFNNKRYGVSNNILVFIPVYNVCSTM